MYFTYLNKYAGLELSTTVLYKLRGSYYSVSGNINKVYEWEFGSLPASARKKISAGTGKVL